MKPSEVTNKVPITLWLLAITAFLTPLLGGSLYVDGTSLAPGIGPLFQSLLTGGDTPQLQYLVLILPLVAATALLLIRGRILAMPSRRISTFLLAFLGFLAVSVLTSSVKVTSIQALVNWCSYGLAFFAISAAVGRVRGPMMVISAMVSGCCLVAVLGIREWNATKATDPTWRIFAGWNNPNALAGMLVVGLILAVALQCSTNGSSSLLSGIAAALIAMALFLTQSRGGILACGIGLLAFLPGLFKTGAKGGFNLNGLAKVAVSLACALVLIALAVYSTRTGGASAGNRLTSSSSATSQSTQFRIQLAKTGLDLIKTSPEGTGLGSFLVVCARPGLVTPTQLAHFSLLQLAVEASILAPLAFLTAIGLWFWKGIISPRQEPSFRILAAGVRAGVLAMLIDGFFESNLYFFGIGLTMAILLGLGVQLSADSVSPEVAPPAFRMTALSGLFLLVLASGYFASVEIVKARARFDRDTDPTSFSNDVATLKTMAPGDPETYYLSAFQPNQDARERLADLETAHTLGPTSRNARALAKVQITLGRQPQAITTLRRSLDDDPNNLLTLDLLLDVQRSSSDLEGAKITAQRLVEIETKPYFTVRSIPEDVPLQTAEARRFLAEQFTDPSKKVSLLQGALDLYVKFAQVTVGDLVDNIKKDGPLYKLADVTPDIAHNQLEQGHSLSAELVELYRTLGLSGDADKAADAGKDLLAAEARLADALSSSK